MIEPYVNAAGEHFEPELDPSAWVHDNATVIGRVRLGARVSIWPSAVLRGDEGRIEIGEDSNIQDGSMVHMTGGLSHTRIGARVTVGHGVILHGCSVGDDSLVGMGAILLDNCEIGSRVVVAAGTLVPMNKKVPDGVLIMGNPFRIVRELRDSDLEMIENGWRTYIARCAEYAAR